jgi:hypothetical protein
MWTVKSAITWFMSIVWTAFPRVNIIAWFWFSGFASPSLGFPGNFTEYISYDIKKV